MAFLTGCRTVKAEYCITLTPRDQRELGCAARASGRGPVSLLDHACSAPPNSHSSRAGHSWFIASAFASVCGSALPLRSGRAPLYAPRRRCFTSARRPQTEAVSSTTAIGHAGASRLHPARTASGHSSHASAIRFEMSVTNGCCVSPTGLLVVPPFPFRPRPFCCTLRPFVTGPPFVSTADAAASVCGSAAALRSDTVPLNAALRLRFTSPACRHADRSRSLHRGHPPYMSALRPVTLPDGVGQQSLGIRDPTTMFRDQRTLRFVDRIIGRSPVSLPTTPGPLHFGAFVTRPTFHLHHRRGGLPSAARRWRCARRHADRSLSQSHPRTQLPVTTPHCAIRRRTDTAR
ncbi:MAG: hypothetical protein PCFJNLEI_02384 [Verrucomicrobiae bacterium]|nr:hypothetical protein [Verrucomicrobiae bacterium]